MTSKNVCAWRQILDAQRTQYSIEKLMRDTALTWNFRSDLYKNQEMF